VRRLRQERKHRVVLQKKRKEKKNSSKKRDEQSRGGRGRPGNKKGSFAGGKVGRGVLKATKRTDLGGRGGEKEGKKSSERNNNPWQGNAKKKRYRIGERVRQTHSRPREDRGEGEYTAFTCGWK